MRLSPLSLLLLLSLSLASALATSCIGCYTVPAVVESAIDIKTVSADVYGIARDPSKGNAQNLLIDGYLPPLSPRETKGDEPPPQPEEEECPGGEERPAENARCRPVVIVVHGGACAVGSRRDELEVELGYALAQRGYATFSVDYRLAGTCVNGGALVAANDVKSAVRYLRTRAGELHLDTSRIALIGASAGAIAVLEAALVRLYAGDVMGRKGAKREGAPWGTKFKFYTRENGDNAATTLSRPFNHRVCPSLFLLTIASTAQPLAFRSPARATAARICPLTMPTSRHTSTASSPSLAPSSMWTCCPRPGRSRGSGHLSTSSTARKMKWYSRAHLSSCKQSL